MTFVDVVALAYLLTLEEADQPFFMLQHRLKRSGFLTRRRSQEIRHPRLRYFGGLWFWNILFGNPVLWQAHLVLRQGYFSIVDNILSNISDFRPKADLKLLEAYILNNPNAPPMISDCSIHYIQYNINSTFSIRLLCLWWYVNTSLLAKQELLSHVLAQ